MQVYPIWTYSYLLALIPVFLLTDLVLYKPMVMIESLSYIVVWSLLVFGSTVFAQQVILRLYGFPVSLDSKY